MLVQEFIDRTGVRPSEDEWRRIEAAYMDADADKDVFCKCWVVCNRERVSKAVQAEKILQRHSLVSGRTFDRVLKFVWCKEDAPEWSEIDVRKVLGVLPWYDRADMDTVRREVLDFKQMNGVNSGWTPFAWKRYWVLHRAVEEYGTINLK